MADEWIRAPMACTVVDVPVTLGQAVCAGQALLVIESMKMEHEIRAGHDAQVLTIDARVGETLAEGARLVLLGALQARAAATPGADASTASVEPGQPAPPAPRADLLEVLERHAVTLDAARPEAVAKRRARGQRTARENIADLCDAGSFVEYGALAVAAQRARRGLDDLIRNTPADGLVSGIGSINGALFGAETTRCAVLAYDATVLAGTQGLRRRGRPPTRCCCARRCPRVACAPTTCAR